MAHTNDNGYQVLGGPGTTDSAGTYSYSLTGPNSASISSQDSVAGAMSQQLVFTSAESGYFYATNAAGFESGTFTIADGPVQFLGNVSFTPDSARANTLSFAAAGSPATLSVTNAAGWIWTLSLPADALLAPRTLTMTPFSNIDAGNALLPVSAGVRLSPAGIQFSDHVTLTVTPPAPLGPHATLLMANDDGSDMYFVPTSKQTNTYSIMICRGMSLSGARTGMAHIPVGLPLTRRGLQRARPGWSAVASGSAPPVTAGPRSASACPRTSWGMAVVSGLSWPQVGLERSAERSGPEQAGRSEPQNP